MPAQQDPNGDADRPGVGSRGAPMAAAVVEGPAGQALDRGRGARRCGATGCRGGSGRGERRVPGHGFGQGRAELIARQRRGRGQSRGGLPLQSRDRAARAEVLHDHVPHPARCRPRIPCGRALSVRARGVRGPREHAVHDDIHLGHPTPTRPAPSLRRPYRQHGPPAGQLSEACAATGAGFEGGAGGRGPGAGTSAYLSTSRRSGPSCCSRCRSRGSCRGSRARRCRWGTCGR